MMEVPPSSTRITSLTTCFPCDRSGVSRRMRASGTERYAYARARGRACSGRRCQGRRPAARRGVGAVLVEAQQVPRRVGVGLVRREGAELAELDVNRARLERHGGRLIERCRCPGLDRPAGGEIAGAAWEVERRARFGGRCEARRRPRGRVDGGGGVARRRVPSTCRFYDAQSGRRSPISPQARRGRRAASVAVDHERHACDVATILRRASCSLHLTPSTFAAPSLHLNNASRRPPALPRFKHRRNIVLRVQQLSLLPSYSYGDGWDLLPPSPPPPATPLRGATRCSRAAALSSPTVIMRIRIRRTSSQRRRRLLPPRACIAAKRRAPQAAAGVQGGDRPRG